MKKTGSRKRSFLSRRRYQLALLIVALVAGVLFRVAYLSSDPPWDFTWSQALFTDGARAIDGARSKIIFDQWIVDKRSPVVLFYPLINLLAYVIFKVLGVGLFQANLSGVIPALATLAVSYWGMRKLTGQIGATLLAFLLSFCYVHVVYSRVPMVESLEILVLMSSFFLLLKGLRERFLCGFLIGLAALMIKMHTLHFLPVAIAFVWLEGRGPKRHFDFKSIGMLALGFIAAFLLWYITIYRINPPIVLKYFKSNIFIAQRGGYANASFTNIITRRLGALVHLGSGKDGFFAKVPVLYILGALGSLSILSGFSRNGSRVRPWERLALVWLAGTMLALSLLSYRPMRYLVLILPSLALVAASFLVRIAEGRPILETQKPKWFGIGFCIWLTLVLIHSYQDVIFKILTASSQNQIWLVRSYQSVWPKVLLFGFGTVAIWLLFGQRLRSAKGMLGLRVRNAILAILIIGSAVNGSVLFGRFAATRKYSIIDGARSLKRILGDGVYLVGDCSTTLSLETDFRTLPAYGDLIRYDEKRLFEGYPITHFLLRFPTLYEYLTKNYPDFKDKAIPIRTLLLCGREATIVRYKDWPGLKKAHYQPTDYEIGMEGLARGDYQSALERFQRFLELNPDSYESLAAASICYAQLGKRKSALEAIEKAVKLSQRDAVVYEIYGDILSSIGQIDEARRAWLTALKLNPNSRKLRAKISRGRF